MLNGMVNTACKNTRHKETKTIPRYIAKLAEYKKLYADKIFERPAAKIYGGRYILVPFAVENGGRLGAHAKSVLRSRDERAVR